MSTSAPSLAARRRICASCKRDIFWRLHVTSDKPAPIDAQPTSVGNLVLEGAERYRVLSRAQLEAIAGDASLDDVPRYTNHFATCPSAERHRPGRR